MKKHTERLTDEQLRKAIAKLDEQKISGPINWVMRVADRFLSKRYRGSGRPRSSDYDYKRIDWPRSIEGKGMVYLDK